MVETVPTHTTGIDVRHDVTCERIPPHVYSSKVPVVLKGLVKSWPLVKKAVESDGAGADYLLSLYNDEPVTVLEGDESQQGRFFYNEDFTGFNFSRTRAGLADTLKGILQQQNKRFFYVGSTTASRIFPDFERLHPMDLQQRRPLVSVWMGNRSRIAAHYDLPENIACVAVGRRRVTLFPPEQLENLYPGPLDFTPAGQQISLVDFHRPDFAAFPRFRLALEQVQVAELEAGDGIFIPSMWWHHIEALGAFNMLVNYWWRNTPDFMGTPINALNLAMMEIRDLPEHQKRVWQAFFDYFIFSDSDAKFDHIPQHIRGQLDKLDDQTSRKLRSQLLARLNR